MNEKNNRECSAAADGYVWRRVEIVSQAREYMLRGGAAARRELVRTTLELDRVLRGAV